MYAAKRRALVKVSGDNQKIKAIYKKCQSFNQEAGYIKYHVDHIKPLSKGGLHHEDNLQILLAKDNLRKGANYNG